MFLLLLWAHQFLSSSLFQTVISCLLWLPFDRSQALLGPFDPHLALLQMEINGIEGTFTKILVFERNCHTNIEV